MTDTLQSPSDTAEASESIPLVAPEPCQEVVPSRGPIGIIFALRLEAKHLLRRLNDKTAIYGATIKMTRGTIAGQEIVVAVSGPGAAAARRTTTAMIDGHSPRIVISAGLAGALELSLPLGRIVLPEKLLDAAGRHLLIDSFPSMAEDADDIDQSFDDQRRLTMVTVDRVATGPAAKADLREKTGAHAVDMETFYTAEICQRRQIPFATVRVIVDPLDRQLPDDVEALLRARSTMRQAGVALRTLWKNPGHAKDLYRLKQETDQALESLGTYWSQLFRSSAENETGEPNIDSLIELIGPPWED